MNLRAVSCASWTPLVGEVFRYTQVATHGVASAELCLMQPVQFAQATRQNPQWFPSYISRLLPAAPCPEAHSSVWQLVLPFFWKPLSSRRGWVGSSCCLPIVSLHCLPPNWIIRSWVALSPFLHSTSGMILKGWFCSWVYALEIWCTAIGRGCQQGDQVSWY